MPDIPGIQDAPTLDSTSLLEMDRLPESLIFLGGGYIGVELAQMMARMGTRVTIDPVMPGCLGLDAMWQNVGFWLGWSGSPGKGRALGVGNVKFTGQVTPDVKMVRYEVDIKRVKRGRLVLGIADGRLYADDKLIYVADDMRVGLMKQSDL